jgi:hypothetical protein
MLPPRRREGRPVPGVSLNYLVGAGGEPDVAKRKRVCAAFDGRRITSDGGVMLLAQAERHLGISGGDSREIGGTSSYIPIKPPRVGVTTQKCSECTTSWTKHERARAGMSAPPLMAAARVAARVTSLTCQEPTFTGPLPNRRSRPGGDISPVVIRERRRRALGKSTEC